ncbi:25511_t:CDS:2 [Dentiscutata erythropus]|uniref:25511_t:CDS:1 n=1 Tax=Dentiscutata erythropus TaxID=1348616 RepID=A0A9N9HAN3_9GLOM|nr:25511_t:CDS:2 [Dentiscutata erythropus]
MIEFKIEHDIVTKNDLGEVNIKRVLKGSGTGKITKILNNDNLLICKSDGIEERDIVQVLSS